VTVGVNADGQKALDDLRAETSYFPEELDAYRFAIAFSIGNGLAEHLVPVKGVDTKYNIGTLDRDQRVRKLIQASFPDTPRPYALAERLAHVGLLHLRTQLVESHRTLNEILTVTEAGDEQALGAEDEGPAAAPSTEEDGAATA
jgi:hypothetical protein